MMTNFEMLAELVSFFGNGSYEVNEFIQAMAAGDDAWARMIYGVAFSIGYDGYDLEDCDLDADLEVGFDPYEGCYDYDC